MKQSHSHHNRDAAISSLLSIRPRFMRSVHLERDIEDPRSSLGYILTPAGQQALERISAAFLKGSTQRAWRLAGDYGSGKTDFALALARVAARRQGEVPKDLHRFLPQKSFKPFLATGDMEPLGTTVLRALGRHDRHQKPTTHDVLAAFAEAGNKARHKGYAGILLILDELGKNFEFAARHPHLDDIFLLQRLAEEAERSADKPSIIVAILHQGVGAYSSGLDSVAKREWAKVAGRFEEIVYAQPVEQVASLLAATLDADVSRLPSRLKEESATAMRAAVSCGLYGRSAGNSLADLAAKIFPLHPSLLPVLVRLMRKFGQNERSLFSFVSSAEPMALQQHAAYTATEAGHYRIHHLFEYVRQNLVSAIHGGTSHTYWGIIESVVASAAPKGPCEDQVLKTVALLSLLDSPDLPATEEVITLGVAGATDAAARAETGKAISALKSRGVLYERGSIQGYCLWPHTSVNLEEAFKKAVDAVSDVNNIDQLCKTAADHLVPRSYYVETGTLRYADVTLVPAHELVSLLEHPPVLSGTGADLHVRIIVPQDQPQRRQALRLLTESHAKLPDGLVVAVADPPGSAMATLAELLAWQWIERNTPELAGDRYGREEVSRQIGLADRNLHDRLRGLTRLATPRTEKLPWFTNQAREDLSPGRELLALIGRECRRLYPKCPKILNELINRESPSAAAVAARSKLADAMTSSPSLPHLGLDEGKRPPEMALYLSILKAGNFHIDTGTEWAFQIPTGNQDKCQLVPALRQITKTLQAEGIDALVPVPAVFSVLARPPYGIRRGLTPFVLAIYLATHHQHVALYEDGTYVYKVDGDVFLRLMKEPQFFHLQYCGLQGVRAEVFSNLLGLLKIAPRDAKRTDLIDLVRPLVTFISQEVPDYARRTNTLSAVTIGVRKALIENREPVRLVFTSLPEACGLPPFHDDSDTSVKEFARLLAGSLHELRTVYPKLIDRLGAAVGAAFDVSHDWSQHRHLIVSRAAQLASSITEPTLRAFALRLADSKLTDRAWVESVANLLAKKSPERWGDSDETEFHHQLELAAGKFRRVEGALMLGVKQKLNGHACRISLTKNDGSEVGDLVSWDGLKEETIAPIKNRIKEILAQHGRHGVAAAVRALWEQLDTEPKQ